MMKDILFVAILIILQGSLSEGLSCYKHGVCYSTQSCAVDAFKAQCASSETFCFKNDLFLDVAERGCAESFTCNVSAPILRRYCCNTDYCNSSIRHFHLSEMIFILSIFLYFQKVIKHQ